MIESRIKLHCPGCGYDLTGAEKHVCPECGRAFDPAELMAGRPLPLGALELIFQLVAGAMVLALIDSGGLCCTIAGSLNHMYSRPAPNDWIGPMLGLTITLLVTAALSIFSTRSLAKQWAQSGADKTVGPVGWLWENPVRCWAVLVVTQTLLAAGMALGGCACLVLRPR